MRIFKTALATGVCFFLLSYITSCSKSSVSKIYVDMSEAQSMVTSSKYLSHVIISITSAGMPLARVVWDNDNPQVLPPAYFELVVPPGPDRLIQYAEVWEDDAAGDMEFFYGDVKRSLDSGDVAVEITVTPFLASGTTKEQRLKGRYIADIAGNSPTGPVEWYIVPPGGKPPIYVEDSFIYGGWMDFILFDNVSVIYKMKGPNGAVLSLSGSESIKGDALETALGASPPQNFFKVTMPDQYYRGISGDCQEVLPKDTEQELFYGYFGPGASAKIAYYSTYTNWPFFANSGCVAGTEMGHTTSLNPNSGYISIKGGSNLYPSACNSNVNLLCLGANMFQSGSIRHALNEGPFRVEQTVVDDGVDPTIDLSWGIFATAKPGLVDFLVFSKQGSSGSSSQEGDDEFLRIHGCAKFLLEKGFSQSGSVSASTPSTSDNYAVFYVKNLTIDQAQNYEFAICPRYSLGGNVVAAPDFIRAHWEPSGP